MGEEGEEKPLWRRVWEFSPIRFLCEIIARFPKLSLLFCVLCVFGIIILMLITVATGQLGLASFAIFEDRSDDVWERSRSFRQAQREANNAGEGDVQPQQSRDVLPMSIIFHGDHDNVFTRENIELMRKIEQHVIDEDDYDKYCFAGDSALEPTGVTCEKPLTVLDYFYPEQLDDDNDDEDGQLIYNGQGDRIVNNITRSLELMAEKQGVFRYSDYFVDKGFRKTKLESKLTRIVFNQGMPLKGYDNIGDIEDFNDMKDDIDSYQVDFLDYFMDRRDEADDMRILWLSDGLANYEITGYLYHDLGLAMISSLLVVCFLWYQLASLWLAWTGVLQVLWTFPFGLLIYRWIFWEAWIGPIHIIAVFIVIGVGVDDIFISVDAFKQSRVAFPEEDLSEVEDSGERAKARQRRLAKRLEWGWRRAAKAMLVTSLTTMAAFIVTAFSPIKMIGTFGIFAAILVFTDYILVSTLFFCSIAVYATHFEGKSSLCCNRNTCWPCFRPFSSHFPQWTKTLPCLPYIFCCCVPVIHTTVLPYEIEMKAMVKGEDGEGEDGEGEELEEEKLRVKVRPIEAFVRNEYGRHVTNRWGRWLVLLYFLLLVAMLVLGAVWTQPSDEETDFIPKGYNFRDALDYSKDFKSQSVTDIRRVSMVWGIDGLDTEGANAFDANDVGDVDYDKSFSLETEEAQQHILRICAESPRVKNLKIKREEDSVRCFLAEFYEWLAVERPLEPVPVVGDRFEPLLREFVRADGYTQKYDDLVGFVDDKLRFVALQFNSTIDDDDTINDQYDWEDAWDDYVDEMNGIAPDGVDNSFAISNTWEFLHIRTLLYRSALIGMFVSLPIAFLVLLIFTMNVIVSIYAVITMLTVVCAMLMVFFVVGWDIGVLESIASILVVGLSVDSTVHLANAYVEAPVKTRRKRTRYALNTVGVSVLSGGISTILAALPLLFSIAAFFSRFGLIIVALIFFSQLMSFGLFCSMCAVIGPQHGIGDLRVPFRWCFRRVKRLAGKDDGKDDDGL